VSPGATVILSVFIAFICSLAIPRIVLFWIERNNLRKSSQPSYVVPPPPTPPGVLFVVRNPRWRNMILWYFGIALLVMSLTVILIGVIGSDLGPVGGGICFFR